MCSMMLEAIWGPSDSSGRDGHASIDLLLKYSIDHENVITCGDRTVINDDGQYTVLIHSNVLSFYKNQNIILDMEFDNNLQIVTLDNSSLFILVGDDNGFLHFVSTIDGNVLFSYQIYQNHSISFKYLTFFPIKSEESLAFGAILSDGTIICISNLQLLNLANPPDIGSIMKHLKISRCKLDMNNCTVQKSFLLLLDGNFIGVVLWDSNNDIYHSNVGIIDTLSPIIELTAMNYLNSGKDIACTSTKMVILRNDNTTIDCYEILDTMLAEKRHSFLSEKQVGYIALLDSGSGGCSNTNVYSVVLATKCAYYTYGVVIDRCMLLESNNNINFSIPKNATNAKIFIESGGGEVKVYCISNQLHKVYESVLHGMTLDNNTVVQSCGAYGTVQSCSTACAIGFILAQDAKNVVTTESNMDIILQLISSASHDGFVLCLVNTVISLIAVTDKIEAILHGAKQYFMNKYHSNVYNLPGFMYVCDVLKSLQYVITNNMTERLSNIASTSRLRQQWLLYARSNQLHTAVLLYNLLIARDSSIVSIADIVSIVKDVPLSTNIQHVIEFVNHHVNFLISLPGDKLQLLSLAVELSKRAVEIEKVDNDAFNSLELSSLCIKYIQSIPADVSNTTQTQIINHIKTLNLYLRMKLSFLVECNYPVMVEDIKRDGMKGITFNILWSFDVNALESHIKLVIIPLLKEYNEDYNAVLADWISVNVNKKLLLYETPVDYADTDEDSVDSYSVDDDSGDDDNNLLRLLVTINLIDNYDIKVKLLLLLLSIPSIDKYPTKPFLAYDTGGEYLIALASDLVDVREENKNKNLRESLVEAIRLYRMKMIARVYGIKSIDPRNPRHVRAAVALISANIVGTQPIIDSMDFINAWSTANYDMSGMLTRALVHRATSIDIEISNIDVTTHTKESNIRELVSVIPSTLNPVLIMQDAIDCMNFIYDDICNDLNYNIEVEYNLLYGNAVLNGVITLLVVFNSTPTYQTNTIAQLLLEYKRIFYLFQDGQYISLLRIRDKEVCKVYGSGIATKRCEDLINEQIATDKLVIADIITPAMHRLGELLQLTPVFYLFTMLQVMISKQQLPLAYAIAELLFREGNELDCGNSVSKADDIKSLQDAAILLCSLPMRGDILTGANNSNVTTENFLLSNKLLCSLCMYCPSPALNDVVSLLNNTDLITNVFSRIEGYIPAPGSAHGSKLSSTMFMKDGLLMSPASIIKPLFNYILNELHRRGSKYLNKIGVSSSKSGSITDVTDLIHILQQTENNMLAIRVLLSSWSTFSITKISSSGDGTGSSSTKPLLLSSLSSLCKKILAYRYIDVDYAIALLMTLPYEMMVKELKLAVPSIQSDFSRLSTIAIVGEEVARLWQQEQLLSVFEDLQMNAKWWHILTKFGIKVDARAFQNPDTKTRDACIRSLVPLLLEKSNMNLTLAREYTQQFDVEVEFATICYIEKLILLPYSNYNDWIRVLQNASRSVDESKLTALLMNNVINIDPLNYEKIRYVTRWILDLLSDESDGSSSNDVTMSSNSTSISCSSDESRNDIHNIIRTKRINFDIKPPMSDIKCAVVAVTDSIKCGIYKRYNEVASFLCGLMVPVSTLLKIPLIAELYDQCHSNTTNCNRLPMWQLLNDPWGIITPLMSTHQDIAVKLAPLTHLLNIDKNEFYVKYIIADYLASSSTDLTSSIENNLQLITDIPHKVKVYKFIYQHNSSGEVQVAMIHRALRLFDSHSTILPVEHQSLKKELIIDLMKFKVSETVTNFDIKLQTIGASRSILPVLNNFDGLHLDGLLKSLFDLVIATAWSFQLKSLDTVCVSDLIAAPYAPVIDEYIKYISDLLHELESHLFILKSFLDGATGDEVDENDENARPLGEVKATNMNNVSALRQSMLVKMLSDADSISVLNNNNSNNSSNSAPIMTSNSIHSWFHSPEASFSTAAVSRRKEDYYLGFAISILINTINDEDKFRTTIAQLCQIVNGSGSRPQRRVTTRSKFRASQALCLLDTIENGISGKFYNSMNLRQSKYFLYCLAEMQEVRVTCPEETLLVALGFDPSSSTSTTKDYKALVRTWLQDEGYHIEVVELCRDVLLMEWSLYNTFDYHIWETLLRHMNTNGYFNSLFQTLVSIRNSYFLRVLCNNTLLLTIFIDCYNNILHEMTRRLTASHYVGGSTKNGIMMLKYVDPNSAITDNIGTMEDVVLTIAQAQALGGLLLTHCNSTNSVAFSNQLLDHSCAMLQYSCNHQVEVIRQVCQLYGLAFLTPVLFRAAKLNQVSYNKVIQSMFAVVCSGCNNPNGEAIVWSLFKSCVLSIPDQYCHFFAALTPLFTDKNNQLLRILLLQAGIAWNKSLDDQRCYMSLLQCISYLLNNNSAFPAHMSQSWSLLTKDEQLHLQQSVQVLGNKIDSTVKCNLVKYLSI